MQIWCVLKKTFNTFTITVTTHDYFTTRLRQWVKSGNMIYRVKLVLHWEIKCTMSLQFGRKHTFTWISIMTWYNWLMYGHVWDWWHVSFTMGLSSLTGLMEWAFEGSLGHNTGIESVLWFDINGWFMVVLETNGMIAIRRVCHRWLNKWIDNWLVHGCARYSVWATALFWRLLFDL